MSLLYRTAESVARMGDAFLKMLARPDAAGRFIELGWADRAKIDALADACRAWSELPDAFTATVNCEALAWVTDATAIPAGT